MKFSGHEHKFSVKLVGLILHLCN